jgi:hypothetical protein
VTFWIPNIALAIDIFVLEHVSIPAASPYAGRLKLLDLLSQRSGRVRSDPSMAKKQVGEPPRLARILRDEMLRSPAKFKLQAAHYAWMFQTPTQADHMALCEIIALHSLGAESFDPTNIFYRLAACNLNMAKAYHCRKQLITVDGATLPTTKDRKSTRLNSSH